MKQSLLLCLFLSLSAPAMVFAQDTENNSDLDFVDESAGDEFGAEDFNPPPPPPPASVEQKSTAEEVQELSLDPGGDVELPKPEVIGTQEESDQKKIDAINAKLKKRGKSAGAAKSSPEKGGEMKRLHSNCQMRAKPNTKSKSLTLVKKGAKVWAENHNSEWVKVYRKKGHAFMSKSCFQ